VKEGTTLWPKRPGLRKITWIVLFTFIFNLAGFTPASFSPLHRVTGTPAAEASAADRDGLGTESFWNFFSDDLGAGWKYSINTFTGNLIIQKDLVTIPGRGIALSEGLVYNSLSGQTGVLGAGWKLENDLFLQENEDGSVIFKDEDGTNHKFTGNADGSYTAPDGVYLKLTKTDTGIFTVKDKANSVFRFESGLLRSIADEKGNTTSFSYDADGRLASVTDPSGRKLNYSYDTNGRLSTITDPAGRSYIFGYDADGRLASVTDPKGGITRFSYDSSGRLAGFTDANGHTTSFFYSAGGRAVKINDARSAGQKEYATTISYDQSLLTTTITDPAGKSIVYTHNSSGNLIQTQDEEGVVKTFAWDKNNPVKVTDASGSTTATYDANGNPTSVTDTIDANNNATATAEYDSLNNPTVITDPNNNQVTARYDTKSNMLSSANPKRKEADANTYDAYGNLTSATDPGAPVSNLLQNGSFEWKDANGKPELWYLGGDASAISVDTSTARYGNSSLKISSATQTSAYVYSRSVSVTPGQKLTLSAFVKMEALSGPGGAGGADIGLEYYDANWNYLGCSYSNLYTGTGNNTFIVTSDAPAGAAYVLAILDMRNAQGTVWFDGAQLESPVNSGEGHILTKFDYVENSGFEAGSGYWYSGGVAGATTITTESPWAGTRCARINLTSSGTAWIRSAAIAVRPGERLTLSGFVKTAGITGSGARVQVQYYDQNNTYLGFNATALQTGDRDYTRYAVAVTPPSNTAYVLVYGNVISSVGTAYFDNLKLVPRSTARYLYDSAGNYLTAAIDPLGSRTDYAYDAAGNRTMVNDPKGNITYFGYDSLNNLTSVTDPLGNISRFEYDPVSLQVTYRDARSASPEDNTYKTVFTYNELNQVTGTIDPLGRRTDNSYDDAGNLASTVFPDGKKIICSYDRANRLSQKSYGSGTEKYSHFYDPAGNLKQVSDEKNRSYQYTFDKANRLTGSTDIFGYGLNYTLDKADNITSVTDTSNRKTSYAYGSANQLLTLTDPSGRQTRFRYDEAGRPFEIIRGNGLKRVDLYDDAGRLKQIADPGTPNNSVLHYIFDANGNIVQEQKNTGVERFSYDALNRLVSWTNEAGNVTAYGFDAAGNLTQKGDKTFTYNAANEITNPGFSYDQNGNLTGDGKFNYHYDSENRLVRVTKVADGSTVAAYEYDYRGLRISKTTSSGTVRYHWDNKERLVRESDANGNTLALYIYDDKDRLIAIEKGGQTYYTHTNYRGDILAITDTNKTRVATYKYGPWGELLSSTGTFSQPFRYAGYYFDEETGLYYLKARYYSPELGRFLTKDTFEGFNNNPQSLNLYAYANGNPVMNVDPDGNVAWWIGVAVGGAAIDAGIYAWQHRNGGFTWGGLAKSAVRGAVTGVALGTAGKIISAGRVAFAAENVTKKTVAGKITGYTKHGLNRAIGSDRIGVSPKAILDAVRNPQRIVNQANNTVKCVGRNATVVLNNTGKVVTTWARNSKGFRR